MHLSAPTAMSASPSIDAYDTQMLDFPSDQDVPMNITGAAEFFAEGLMDHDGHLATSAYTEHVGVEVDMEEYAGDNAEYEMADETAEYPRSHGDELLDIEVYDASHVPSPLVPPQPLQPSIDVTIDSEHAAPTPSAFSDHATLPESQREPESEVPPARLEHPGTDVPHVESSASGEGVSSGTVPFELALPTEAPSESTLPISESHEQLGDATHTDGQLFETPAPVDVVNQAELHVSSTAEEHPVDSEVQHETPAPPTAESAPLASAEQAYTGDSLIQDEKVTDRESTTEGEVVDPLHISDGVYIDPPPAVFLSIADPFQPEFVLFNQPDFGDESVAEPRVDREGYSLLLENQPTLYYESLSSVFEVLRQDEALLSRFPNSFEGELVLDAYDLQLAVAEDNVHSREISLHDLNILHDGSDLVGPLRLLLRVVIPRFIIRYYALQEQIQRSNVTAEITEGEEHVEERHGHYDTGEGQRLPEQDEAVTSAPGVVSDSSEVAPITEPEEPVKEPVCLPGPAEEAQQESDEPEDISAVQEPAAEYHEVTGEATHALEDEDDYQGINTGGEDESAKSESLDADQIHDTAAEDTDAAATVTGHGLEFGGEQNEYLDYVQAEEYDERYGEDLPERAGGTSPVQYGESQHHEEEGEQDTSTAVDETRAILPGSDDGEDEEGRSAATPVPAHAVLEPGLNEPTDDKATDASVLPKPDETQSREELVTSESTNEVVNEQASGNENEINTAQAEVFQEIEESDSNFVSMLEREADAEFDRSFNGEQNEQEGSIGTALQHEPNWDEWDDEDAEGEDEENWIDPDAASNESSVTLSSKASTKRGYDELDPSEEAYVEDPHASPGSKRPRVQ